MKKGITISFGIQKGGSSKTTTACIVSFLLARQGYKVLFCDFDSQGNGTSLLTQQNIYDFTKRTILEAIKEQNAKKYIHHITDNLHILPAEDFLARLPSYIYVEYRAKFSDQYYQDRHLYLLKDTLDQVKHEYDFIIIDLPPSPGEQTHLGLIASDYAVIMLQTEPFCYDALDRYLEILSGIQQRWHPDLRVAGIICSMLDPRSTLEKEIIEAAKTNYGDLLFNVEITRKNKIKEFSYTGISDKRKEEKAALEVFEKITEELLERVAGK